MRVVLTGIAGRLGREVTGHLLALGHDVIGLDERRARSLPAHVVQHQIDVAKQQARAMRIFADVRPDAVVHLGVVHHGHDGPDGHGDAGAHNAANARSTDALIRLVLRAGTKKLVLLSSGDVYGPLPANSHFLGEDAPLRASQRFPEVRALVAVDRAVQAFACRFPEVHAVILRPAHIVGPHVRNAASNYLRLKRLPTQMGFDPMLQLTSEHDVCRALAASLSPGMRGVFNVASTEPVPLSRVLQALGKPVLPIPHPLFAATLKRLWQLGLTSFLPPELDHIRFHTVLDTTRASEILGIPPTAELTCVLQPFCAAAAGRGH